MFRWRDLRGLFWVNLREYLRDPLAAGFAFAFPLLFLVVFGMTSRAAESRVSEVVVVTTGVDRAPVQPVGDEVIRILASEPSLRVTEASDLGAARAKLTGKEIEAVVSLGDAPTVIVRGEGRRFGQWLSERIEIGQLRVRSVGPASTPPVVEALPGSTRSAFDYIAPGIFALALLQLGLFGTGNQILAARSRGALRRLRLTPVSERAIIGSHVLVRVLIAATQIALLLIVASLMFDFQVKMGLAPLVLTSVTGAVTLALMGYAIGGIAPTMQSGSMLIMLSNFVMMFSGQVFFDLRRSEFGEVLSYLNPVSLVSDSFRYVITGEAQATPFWMNQIIVCVWGVALLLITLRYFKHSMDNV